ncbi:hypothetical protein BpHYR1_039410 [Brachionus plicatilis]|uniref:Uncharacterized protein n=1 Tax=Brachionus plicatilis TaxID=10195 RepID=A0A3M7R2P0_BRAPC|nr:hypothetical protein BpHYR1_039410 [Brachionus plicatilis]
MKKNYLNIFEHFFIMYFKNFSSNKIDSILQFKYQNLRIISILLVYSKNLSNVTLLKIWRLSWRRRSHIIRTLKNERKKEEIVRKQLDNGADLFIRQNKTPTQINNN